MLEQVRMNNKVTYRDLGLIDYKKAWDYQEELFRSITEQKVRNRKQPDQKQDQAGNYLLFCEHPHVFTLGRNGSEKNLLVNPVELKRDNISYYRINRGGDITYHGPGQIVGYPILDLEPFGLQIRQYIHALEEVIIRTLERYRIRGQRLEGATGVWLDSNVAGKERKICAIGVKISRYVTMHGFALNVNTDLSWFTRINPCGITGRGVTSMEREMGSPLNIDEVKKELKRNFAAIIGMEIL